MAEIVIISKLAEAIVSHSVERITDLLIDEAVSLKNVKTDVEKFVTELKRIQCFLKDADRKQHQDERVRNWINEVKQVSEEMEDVIDIYITKVSSSFFNFNKLRRLKKEINSVQEKLDSITKSTQTYKIEFSSGEGTSSDAELLRKFRRVSPDDDDDTDDVISLKDTEKALKDQLMEERDQLRIVSVVGMGGLGKTFLTKKVYNQTDVKNHFDCRAWVCISQQYIWDDVLYQILVQLEPEESKREKSRGLKDYELAKMLKEKLKEKRYVVVLDDIWDIKAWDGIKKAFPKGKCGSKVVFTTRDMKVATTDDQSNTPIEPPFLSEEESWELLRRRVFHKDAFNEKHEEMGKYMARKCGGLPLAIVTLGGLLRTRNSISEWQEVQSDLNAYLNKIHTGQQYEGVNSILALSYHHLPYYLKPCFLYFSSLQEDEEIQKNMLIQEWIAQGLIVQDARNQEKATQKEIAEHYLEELVDRCMIQMQIIYNNNYYYYKACRIHDLLRDLSLAKARDENFSIEVAQNQQMDSISSRRIVIHDGNIDLNRYQQITRLRSLISSSSKGLFYLINFSNERFLLLRVLKIRISLSELKNLKSIGNLIHLRYLGLSVYSDSIGAIYLPNSIGKLRNLRTLYFQGHGKCIVLPKETSKLTRLTYLHLDNLWLKEQSVGSLVKLSNLEYLHIEFKDKQDAMLIFNSPIIRSGNLRSLTLFKNANRKEHGVTFQSFRTLSHCHRLYHLHLNIRLEQPIDCLNHLPANLSKLILGLTYCETDPMPVLEKLPNLRHLLLIEYAYVGSHMVCSVHGFSKLESLYLSRLSSLEEWIIEKDSMPNLKILTLEMLHDLRMIPEGLQFITTLTHLDISEMDESFQKRVGREGEDFYKVRHIPSIKT